MQEEAIEMVETNMASQEELSIDAAPDLQSTTEGDEQENATGLREEQDKATGSREEWENATGLREEQGETTGSRVEWEKANGLREQEKAADLREEQGKWTGLSEQEKATGLREEQQEGTCLTEEQEKRTGFREQDQATVLREEQGKATGDAQIPAGSSFVVSAEIHRDSEMPSGDAQVPAASSFVDSAGIHSNLEISGGIGVKPKASSLNNIITSLESASTEENSSKLTHQPGRSVSYSEIGASMGKYQDFDEISPDEYPEWYTEGQYDVLIIHSVKDEEGAIKLMELLQSCVVLTNGEAPAVCTLNSSLTWIQSQFRSLEEAVGRSTYIFLYMTHDFCEDEWAEMQRDECLTKSLNDPNKRWCVIPAYTRPKSTFKIPMGLCALKGLDLSKVLKNEDITSLDLDTSLISSRDRYVLPFLKRLISGKLDQKMERKRLDQVKLQHWIEEEKYRRARKKMLEEYERTRHGEMRQREMQEYQHKLHDMHLSDSGGLSSPHNPGPVNPQDTLRPSFSSPHLPGFGHVPGYGVNGQPMQQPANPFGYPMGPMGYPQPGVAPGPMGYPQPGVAPGPMGYPQPGVAPGPMGYPQPGVAPGPMGYPQPGVAPGMPYPYPMFPLVYPYHMYPPPQAMMPPQPVQYHIEHVGAIQYGDGNQVITNPPMAMPTQPVFEPQQTMRFTPDNCIVKSDRQNVPNIGSPDQHKLVGATARTDPGLGKEMQAGQQFRSGWSLNSQDSELSEDLTERNEGIPSNPLSRELHNRRPAPVEHISPLYTMHTECSPNVVPDLDRSISEQSIADFSGQYAGEIYHEHSGRFEEMVQPGSQSMGIIPRSQSMAGPDEAQAYHKTQPNRAISTIEKPGYLDERETDPKHVVKTRMANMHATMAKSNFGSRLPPDGQSLILDNQPGTYLSDVHTCIGRDLENADENETALKLYSLSDEQNMGNSMINVCPSIESSMNPECTNMKTVMSSTSSDCHESMGDRTDVTQDNIVALSVNDSTDSVELTADQIKMINNNNGVSSGGIGNPSLSETLPYSAGATQHPIAHNGPIPGPFQHTLGTVSPYTSPYPYYRPRQRTLGLTGPRGPPSFQDLD